MDTPTSFMYRIVSDHLHLLMVIALSRQFLRIWIISEGWHSWIRNHYRLQMKPSVAEITAVGSDPAVRGKEMWLTLKHQR